MTALHLRPDPPVFDRERLGEVCTRLAVDLLVLFGSRATGSPPPTEGSDLDLAVWPRPGSGRPPWEYAAELAPLFPAHELDVATLAGADPLFRWEVMREGVVLWGDLDRFAELRGYAYRDFVDSADLRAVERLLFDRKLAWLRRRLDRAPA